MNGDLDSDSQVVDVWDRQWLSLKLAKSSPQAAQVYMVNVRLTGITMAQLVIKSGSSAIYVEARDETGRSPHSDYRVIWLPSLNKGAALAAIQTSPHPASLVRQGQRFGLRTCMQHAESLHQLHKPKVPYLHSAQLRSFSVGPLPFNCTRASLAKMFETMNWKARAVQPRGRAQDGSGVIWSVQAEQGPMSEAYQMSHGDIIITEDDMRRPVDTRTQVDLMASAKTVAALRGKASSSAHGNPQQDPWEHADPWQQSRAKRVKTSPPELSNQQMKVLEENLKDKILGSLPRESTDVTMATDDARMNSFEARLQQVEQTMQQQASVQQQQHQELTQTITAVQHNVDQQARNMNQILDSRFSEQLSQIERLLGKKARVGELE